MLLLVKAAFQQMNSVHPQSLVGGPVSPEGPFRMLPGQRRRRFWLVPAGSREIENEMDQ